jgi:hypothetical protein
MTRGPAVLIENGEAVAIMIDPEAYDRLVAALKDLQTEFEVDRRAAITRWERIREHRARGIRELPRTINDFLTDREMSLRELRILRLRFGLEDGKYRTQEETGRHLGLSASSISKLEQVMFRRLRHRSAVNDLASKLHQEGIWIDGPFSANPDIEPHYAALLDKIYPGGLARWGAL